MTTQSVKISVEKLLEQQVEEISRTGEEKYVRPLTISEELTELAQKIDFDEKDGNCSAHDDESDPESELQGTEEKDRMQGRKGKSWPWESLHSKLRTTLQEVCVLLDVLQTVKQRKYVVLDPVTQKEETPQPTVQMLGKRKSLKRAADIIYQGATRMDCKIGNEFRMKEKKDYFHELMKLRQRWRVKKSGNFVGGDLSYRTAGSGFWHPGLFEVTKTEWEEESQALHSEEEALGVKVGSDLEGCTTTIFKIKRDILGERLVNAVETHSPTQNSGLSGSVSWQKQLELSQRNLFFKELYGQLAREAYVCPTYATTELSRDEIEVKLPFDYSMIIINKKQKDNDADGCRPSKGDSLEEYMKYRAARLLRSQHKQVLGNASVQPPTSAKPVLPSDHGLASFFLKPRQTTDVPTLFEKLVSEAKHCILRELRHSVCYCKCSQCPGYKTIALCRTAKVIDEVAATWRDPKISCHWGMASSTTRSSVIVSLLSRKTCFEYRSSFHIELSPAGYHIVTDNCLVVDFSGSPDRLRDFIMSMISLHLLDVAQSRLDHYGWAIRQLNKTTLLHLSSEIKSDEMTSGLLAERSCGTTLSIQMRSGNDCTVTLEEAQADDENSEVKAFLGKEWLSSILSRDVVSFKRVPGNSFVEKFDCLLAMLSK